MAGQAGRQEKSKSRNSTRKATKRNRKLLVEKTARIYRM